VSLEDDANASLEPDAEIGDPNFVVRVVVLKNTGGRRHGPVCSGL